MSKFSFTEKQLEAQAILAGSANHVMLFGGSRCVAGNVVLDGYIKTIAEMAKDGIPVKVLTSHGFQWAETPFLKGNTELMKVTLEDGKSIEVTPDHKFWSDKGWTQAKEITLSSLVAVQSSLLYPQQSNSEPCLSKYLSGEQHLIHKDLNCNDDYCKHPHLGDEQPLRELACVQVSGASLSDVLEHTQNENPVCLHESNSQTHLGNLSELKDIRYDLQQFHHSKMDVSLGNQSLLANECHVYDKTSVSSLDCSQNDLQADLSSCLAQLEQATLDSGYIRSDLFYDLCIDFPCSYGYQFVKVLSITQTAKQDYYTLHVPITQQYFANGILNHNSGKTFLLLRNIVFRALKAPGSRHLVARFRYNHVKTSVAMDTLPKVMELAFPGVTYNFNKADLFFEFENGSTIWMAGLDDKERTEKILGHEYATIYLNECSQIPWASREIAVTRLAQRVFTKMEGREPSLLKTRMYYDCNPPNKGHWTYRVFVEQRDPETREMLRHQEDYAMFKINPQDNVINLSNDYLHSLEGLGSRLRTRFLLGEFADANPFSLFNEDDFHKWRTFGSIPELIRIVVGVDPSGSGDTDNADNDAIGICVGGIGVDGNAYLLADCTVKASPAVWGRVVADAFDRYGADVVVAEANYGGAMVKHVIDTARPRTPFKAVTATRGKVVRAEPFSSLYEQGKIRHVGDFTELEDELCSFSTNGYLADRSPNRADAWIWCLAELFPAIISGRKKPPVVVHEPEYSWMG